MTDNLCTAAQVKARLGITDATDDALIAEVIGQVSDEIQAFTGRRLVPEAAATYTFDTYAGHVLQVPAGIRSVSSMSVAATDQPDTGGSYLAVDLSAVLVRPLAIDRRPGWPGTEIRLRSSPISTSVPFRTAANGATITGDFGWSVTPPAIARIAIAASVTEYLDRRRAGQAGPDGIDLPELLSSTDLAVLTRFATSRTGGIA